MSMTVYQGRTLKKPAYTGATRIIRGGVLDTRKKYRSRVVSAARAQMIVPSRTYRTGGWTNTKGELKYKDIDSAIYQCDSTGFVVNLNQMAQGDDVINRIGRQINNQSIRIHGYISPNDTTTLPNYVRILLVWDAQPNSAGAVPAITDILSGASSVSNTNLDNRERFTILRDFKKCLGGINNTATQSYAMDPTVCELDWFVNLKGAKTTYSGTSGTINTIATGSLLLVTIGTASPGNGNQFNATTRLRFTDN